MNSSQNSVVICHQYACKVLDVKEAKVVESTRLHSPPEEASRTDADRVAEELAGSSVFKTDQEQKFAGS